jgi:hypothetical protein
MAIKWHPCEIVPDGDSVQWKGIPDKSGEYLVTIKSRRTTFVEITEFDKTALRMYPDEAWGTFWNDQVIAWAELPEPYKKPKK